MYIFDIIRHISAVTYFFFFNNTATTEIYTLSLHDALPILLPSFTSGAIATHWLILSRGSSGLMARYAPARISINLRNLRSEEHTSELQSQSNLVCRLLLEKKKSNTKHTLEVNNKT